MRNRPAILVGVFLTALSLCLAPAWLEAADQNWPTAGQIGPALLRAEFRLDERTMAALSHIDTTKADLSRDLGLVVPETPVELYLFRSKGTYDRYIRTNIPEGRGRAALFVKSGGAGKVYAYYSSRLDVDIRHESTHAFLHAALPYVPLWLDEGLAEYFEVPPESRFANHEHLKSLKRSMWFRWSPRLDRLESLASLNDMGEAEYRESWAWVHFMMHGPEEARVVLRTYLAEIASQQYAGKLAPRLRAAVPDLDNALKLHHKSIK